MHFKHIYMQVSPNEMCKLRNVKNEIATPFEINGHLFGILGNQDEHTINYPGKNKEI